jgi:phosphoribosyl-AMP cyclohydrolase
MTAPQELLAEIRFDATGLIPAVVQEIDSGAVLMVGFMNREALAATLTTKRTHFWSRSRGKLWRKGETSGHEQIVEDVYVNCEQNSLLIAVRQIGAACHDGYPTCYYRRVQEDGSFVVVRDRWFDPAELYSASGETETVEALTRRWYGAYEYLRDTDLSSVSTTAARLRGRDPNLSARVADELLELAGVLTGDHRHGDTHADLLLESSQALYWLALLGVMNEVSWDRLRPDRALATSAERFAAASAATLLRVEAETWRQPLEPGADLAARLHAAIALVAQACRAGGASPVVALRADLDDLRTKSYLAGYFQAFRS